MKHILAITALLLGTATAATTARADEVSDTLESALSAYNEGDIQYALEELEFAKQLIMALKTDALSAFLPEAPNGWAREVNSEMNSSLASWAAAPGGPRRNTAWAISSFNHHHGRQPDDRGLCGMIGNAAVMGGAKLERVGRMKYMNQDGELSGLVDNRILIQAKGAPVEVMIPLLETIDVKALEDFGG